MAPSGKSRLEHDVLWWNLNLPSTWPPRAVDLCILRWHMWSSVCLPVDRAQGDAQKESASTHLTSEASLEHSPGFRPCSDPTQADILQPDDLIQSYQSGACLCCITFCHITFRSHASSSLYSSKAFLVQTFMVPRGWILLWCTIAWTAGKVHKVIVAWRWILLTW